MKFELVMLGQLVRARIVKSNQFINSYYLMLRERLFKFLNCRFSASVRSSRGIQCINWILKNVNDRSEEIFNRAKVSSKASNFGMQDPICWDNFLIVSSLSSGELNRSMNLLGYEKHTLRYRALEISSFWGMDKVVQQSSPPGY